MCFEHSTKKLQSQGNFVSYDFFARQRYTTELIFPQGQQETDGKTQKTTLLTGTGGFSCFHDTP